MLSSQRRCLFVREMICAHCRFVFDPHFSHSPRERMTSENSLSAFLISDVSFTFFINPPCCPEEWGRSKIYTPFWYRIFEQARSTFSRMFAISELGVLEEKNFFTRDSSALVTLEARNVNRLTPRGLDTFFILSHPLSHMLQYFCLLFRLPLTVLTDPNGFFG